MPIEAEWEYAARGGGRDIVFPWGGEEAGCEHEVFYSALEGSHCGVEGTKEVCIKTLGNTAQGLCDIAGNVWEWVEDDWHENYKGAPSDGRAWIDTPRRNGRVLREGSWNWNSGTDYCRPSARFWSRSDVRSSYGFGFRVVLDTN